MMAQEYLKPQTDRLALASRVTLYAFLVGGLSNLSAVERAMAGSVPEPASDVPSAHDLLDPVVTAQPLPPAPAPVPTPETISAPSIEFSPVIPPPAASPQQQVVPPLPTIDLSELKTEGALPSATPGTPDDSTYIDTTDYSLGATPSPSMIPDIVITERSTGCKTVLPQGQAFPSSLCGRSTSPSPLAGGHGSLGQNPVAIGQPFRVLPQVNEVTIGPLSVGANGIQVTRPLSVQDYYNRTERPKAISGNGNNRLLFPLSVPALISSPFGMRVHPIFGGIRMHTGTDLAAPMGTPVVAAYSGRVAIADFLGGYGLTVVIGHNQKSAETLYGHLSEVFVKAGEWVEQGEVIGRVGSTGNSTGPHLHFELRQQTAKGWTAVNSGSLLQQGLNSIHAGFQLGEGFSIADATLMDPASGEAMKLAIPEVLQQGKDAVKDDVDRSVASSNSSQPEQTPQPTPSQFPAAPTTAPVVSSKDSDLRQDSAVGK